MAQRGGQDYEFTDQPYPYWRKVDAAPAQGGSMIPGQILMWPTDTPPTGFLICDGSQFDATRYPALYGVLGDDMLPDLRGQFVRGYDPTGDAVLSQHNWTTGMPRQGLTGTTSTRGAHTHGIRTRQGSSSDGHNTRDYMGGYNSGSNWSSIPVSSGGVHNGPTTSAGNHSHTVTITGGGDAETAPDHVILAYIIATDEAGSAPPSTPPPPVQTAVVVTPSFAGSTLSLTVTGGPSTVDNTLTMPIVNDGTTNYDISSRTASYQAGDSATLIAGRIKAAIDGFTTPGGQVFSAGLSVSPTGDMVVEVQIDNGAIPITAITQHISGTNEEVIPSGTPTNPPTVPAPPHATETVFDYASLTDYPATVEDWRSSPNARLCAVFHPSTQLGIIMLRTNTRVPGGSLQAGGTQFLAAMTGEGIGSVALLNGTALIEATSTTGGTAPLRTAVQNWGGPAVTDDEIFGNFQYCYYAEVTMQSSPSTGSVMFATLHRAMTMADTARLEIIP